MSSEATVITVEVTRLGQPDAAVLICTMEDTTLGELREQIISKVIALPDKQYECMWVLFKHHVNGFDYNLKFNGENPNTDRLKLSQVKFGDPSHNKASVVVSGAIRAQYHGTKHAAAETTDPTAPQKRARTTAHAGQ